MPSGEDVGDLLGWGVGDVQEIAITGRPLFGLTFVGTGADYGARVCQQQGPRHYVPNEAGSVCVVGDRLTTFNERRLPALGVYRPTGAQRRGFRSRVWHPGL